MISSTLTSKGQTTIPKVIRERLNLQPGNRIDYVLEEDGRAPPVAVLSGIAQGLGVPHELDPPGDVVGDVEARAQADAGQRIAAVVVGRVVEVRFVVGGDAEDFEGPRYVRLARIRELIAAGRLDDELRMQASEVPR